MLSLSLDWQHCPDGVELHDYGKPKLAKPPKGVPAGAASPLLTGPPSGLCFRCRSAKRFPVRYVMTTLEDLLLVRFVNARDDKSMAAFLGRFGFLYGGAVVSRVGMLAQQKLLRAFLGFAAGGEPVERLQAANRSLDDVKLSPQFVHDGDAVRMTFRPQHLFDFMAAEVAMVAAHGARLSACQHCGTEFLTGPLTGRRASAQYCADKCRVAAMRARNA
jgi:hypothetical protein